jgi:flagellar biosynthesis/type III secretory pathway protein FliH
MTIAEQLEAKGHEKGKLEGYQLGRQDGVNQGKQEATLPAKCI